jgi:hypothetical protein
MATRRRRSAHKPDPTKRLDDLVFRIERVQRAWSRGPRLDSTGRLPEGLETSDRLEIAAHASQPNTLEIEHVRLTVYGADRAMADDREFLGLCNRVRGERGQLSAYLWLPLAEVMALAPPLVTRQFAELDLRVRGFFRSAGRIQSIEFKTEMTAYEDWVIEVAEQKWEAR